MNNVEDKPISAAAAKLLAEFEYPPAQSNDFYMGEGEPLHSAFVEQYLSAGLPVLPAPTCSRLAVWLHANYNMTVLVGRWQEYDYMDDVTTVEYTVTISDWNNIVSTHDGTGLQMAMHWYVEGGDYCKVFDEAIIKALEELKRSQTD